MTPVPPAVMAAVLACTDRTIPTPRRPKETPMTDTKGTDVTGLAPQIHRGEAMSERVHREPRGTECANCMATNTKSVGFAAPGTYVPSGEVIRLCPECTGALRGGAFAVLSERFSREPSHVE